MVVIGLLLGVGVRVASGWLIGADLMVRTRRGRRLVLVLVRVPVLLVVLRSLR